MKGFDLVDDVLKEPVGGAHARPEEMAAIVKDYLVKTIANLQSLDAETRIQQRIDKFSKMGFYDEVPVG
jgi:acetyl-CoA carboxylase carboxyl transferase subunit alpha